MSGTYQNDVPPPYQPIDPSAARNGGRWGTQPHRSSLNSNVAGSHAQQNQTERTPLTAGGRRYHHNRRTPPQELHTSTTININPPPLPVQPVSIPNQTWLRTHQPSKRRTIPIFSLFMAACFLAIGFLAGFHRGQYTNILDPAVRERIRSDWALEEAGEAQRRRQVADEQARERARWESEKREHERDAAAEKMRRMRARLYWTDLMPKEDECLASGLRGYSARLANVPDGIDVLAACKELPLVFQGVKYDSPEHCESGWRGVHGHWKIKDDHCATYWESNNRQGCTSPHSGLRRFEARLGSLREQDDPLTMCFSTPNEISGHHFDKPIACPHYWGWGITGYWGIWDVPDDSCK